MIVVSCWHADTLLGTVSNYMMKAVTRLVHHNHVVPSRLHQTHGLLSSSKFCIILQKIPAREPNLMFRCTVKDSILCHLNMSSKVNMPSAAQPTCTSHTASAQSTMALRQGDTHPSQHASIQVIRGARFDKVKEGPYRSLSASP